MNETTLPFPYLVALLVTGGEPVAPETDTIAGEVRVRDVRQVDSDAAPVANERLETRPDIGRVAVGDYGYRVMRRGELARRESLDGTVNSIDGTDTVWLRNPGGDEVTAYRRTDTRARRAGAFAGLDIGGPRPAWSRWDGTDFTRPTGPVAATEFLGRPAWTVELAPPAHKRYPIQLVVDATSGRLLSRASVDSGSIEEWVDVRIGAPLADELFVWDGPSIPPPSRAERDAQFEQELAHRRAWLTGRGIRLPLPVQPQLHLNAWDDTTGAFHASLEVYEDGSLLRRPRSTRVWTEADELRWPNVYRWSDDDWDWCLGCGAPLPDDQLAGLRLRLAAST